MTFISSLAIINVIVPDPFFLSFLSFWIAASVAGSTADSLSTFPVKGKPVFSNGQEVYQ